MSHSTFHISCKSCTENLLCLGRDSCFHLRYNSMVTPHKTSWLNDREASSAGKTRRSAHPVFKKTNHQQISSISINSTFRKLITQPSIFSKASSLILWWSVFPILKIQLLSDHLPLLLSICIQRLYTKPVIRAWHRVWVSSQGEVRLESLIGKERRRPAHFGPNGPNRSWLGQADIQKIKEKKYFLKKEKITQLQLANSQQSWACVCQSIHQMKA